jgi:hypothetical protein
MNNVLRSSWIASALLAGLIASASAETPEVVVAEEGGVAEQPAAKEGKKGEARFAFGLTYAAGMVDVGDRIEEVYALDGNDVDMLVIPIGPSIVAGYRFKFGLELLGDVGPVSFIAVDDTVADDIFTNIDIPMGVTVGYAFLTDKSVSPYLRGGFRYHFSEGDFTDSSSAGLYVAGGINFFSNKAVQLQVEVAYDAAEVTYKAPDFYGGGDEEDLEPGGLLISVRAAF